MPYQIVWENRGVRWIYSGVVTGQEALDSNFEIYSDERFDELKYELVDFSGAESFEVSEQEIKKIAYMDMAATNSNPNIRVAIVADGEFKKLLDMYEKYSERSSWEVNVFETLEEAEKWLGIEAS